MRVFLIAGEVSGDRLGGALLAGLRTLVPDLEVRGVGGPEMAAQGLDSLFPMEDLSVMGLAEVLPKLKHLFARRDEAVQAVLDWAPDVLITIDSPDFCLRVAREVRAANPDIRTVHYVAPTVWAWRPKRAEKMAAFIDHVLALLPFEPPYMEAAGMECDFVGHPVVTEPQAGPEERAAFRAALGIDGEMLLVLPGSREGEVSRLIGRFGQVAAQLVAARPGLRAVVVASMPVAGILAQVVPSWPGAPVLLDPRDMKPDQFAEAKRAAFGAADAALAASGTVSLELAAAGTPMVIGYDMGFISRMILPRLLMTDTVTLVNLVSETRVVPEFIGSACKPGPIAAAVGDVLDAPGEQAAALALTMERLGKDGEAPGLRAARAVLARM